MGLADFSVVRMAGGIKGGSVLKGVVSMWLKKKRFCFGHVYIDIRSVLKDVRQPRCNIIAQVAHLMSMWHAFECVDE